MAIFNQHSAVVSLDDTSGSLTDYSSSIISVTVQASGDNAQYGVLGDITKKTSVGKFAITGQIVTEVDTSATSAYYMLSERVYNSTYFGEDVTIQIDKPDGTNGSLRLTGEIKILGVEESTEDGGDVARATFDYAFNGGFTRSVIST
jgi:hypothetical protein